MNKSAFRLCRLLGVVSSRLIFILSLWLNGNCRVCVIILAFEKLQKIKNRLENNDSTHNLRENIVTHFKFNTSSEFSPAHGASQTSAQNAPAFPAPKRVTTSLSGTPPDLSPVRSSGLQRTRTILLQMHLHQSKHNITTLFF